MLQLSASALKSPGLNQTVLNQSNNPIFVVDEEGQITFADAQAEKLFGLSATDLVGELLPEDCFLGKLESIGHGFGSTAPLKIDGHGREAVLVIHDTPERSW